MRPPIKEFQISDYNVNEPIIVYGAGIFGEYTFHALAEQNIRPSCFYDRAKDGGEYFGIPVLTPSRIHNMKQAKILIAVGAQFNEVAKFLLEEGFQNIYSVYEFIFDNNNIEKYKQMLSLQGQDIDYYKALYRFGQNYGLDKNELKLISLDFVITQKCSLKCKNCSNLMQYYTNPMNFKQEDLYIHLTTLLKYVDEIMDLRIIGGEPFMNKDMAGILNLCLGERKINNISIYTNATILPPKELIPLLKHNKIKCEITDYGDLSHNTNKFIDIMKKENIRHHIVTLTEWHDLGLLENRNRTLEEMTDVFNNCFCNDLLTLLNGKLYICPYSAHGRSLGAIPEFEQDYVNVNNYVSEVKDRIRSFILNKKFDYACGYCNGRNNHIAVVKPAEQTAKPLEYKKWCD